MTDSRSTIQTQNSLTIKNEKKKLSKFRKVKKTEKKSLIFLID